MADRSSGGRIALANAVAAAVNGEEVTPPTNDSDKDDEVTATLVVEDPKSKEEQTPPVSAEVENEVDDDADEGDEVPDTVFGIDLSVLPDDEARRTFLREFTETNRTINKLQREKAERADRAPAPEPGRVDFSQLSDEDVASALGLNLEESADPAAASAAIALARGFADLREQIASLTSSTTVSATEQRWDKALNELEGKFGKLEEAGISRADLLEHAADSGIDNPETAYWAVLGPIRFEVSEALKKKLTDARRAGKKAATTPRPRSSAEVDEAALVSKDVKSATKEAFDRAMKKLGVNFAGNE